ncbi:hypothetical protein HJG60_012146 [Phyllostomus discolor]|uniref:Uncharacterized protein n=1 Tax=Phyllostomus discolor TaxID=89673 RepID=A0A834DWS4_9CHIR|nr:hypothetical protein HJG60_012146 [Phyllostomus discolor]
MGLPPGGLPWRVTVPAAGPAEALSPGVLIGRAEVCAGCYNEAPQAGPACEPQHFPSRRSPGRSPRSVPSVAQPGCFQRLGMRSLSCNEEAQFLDVDASPPPCRIGVVPHACGFGRQPSLFQVLLVALPPPPAGPTRLTESLRGVLAASLVTGELQAPRSAQPSDTCPAAA